MPTEAEIAWAAGLFEGEGCVAVAKPHRKDRFARFRISIQMTDQDVVEKFQAVAGFGSVAYLNTRTTQERGHKPSWRWVGTGIRAELFALQLVPHLGSRRAARIAEARTFVNQTNETVEATASI